MKYSSVYICQFTIVVLVATDTKHYTVDLIKFECSLTNHRVGEVELGTEGFPNISKSKYFIKNFSPVSNLPFISKLTEKAVFDQTYNLMVENDLYPPNLSSYRKNHSTETALLKVTNDIHLNMNKQHVTLLVLLDLLLPSTRWTTIF